MDAPVTNWLSAAFFQCIYWPIISVVEPKSHYEYRLSDEELEAENADLRRRGIL
jgi:hypothetical protein